MAQSSGRSRRQQILEALAAALETHPGERVTTARLAADVGVSEAALYRHFPSKAKMFEALIEFAEESVFGLVGRILVEEDDGVRRCERIARMVLAFSGRNPGITRVLTGDALLGEADRLRARSSQFFERLETQLRQILREHVQRRDATLSARPEIAAGILMALVEGRMARFGRSGFRRDPTESWEPTWEVVANGLFREAGG